MTILTGYIYRKAGRKGRNEKVYHPSPLAKSSFARKNQITFTGQRCLIFLDKQRDLCPGCHADLSLKEPKHNDSCEMKDYIRAEIPYFGWGLVAEL